MFRIAIVSVFALASAIIANAGQIQVGGVNGLTNAYVTGNCGGACITGSTGGATEQNYDTVLFSNLTNGSVAPKPYSTYDTFTANTGTITDGSVTFAMINDGTNSNLCQGVVGGQGCQTSNNYWMLAQPNNPFLTVPIGVFAVSDVWTMVNTTLAQAASVPDRTVTVTFNFGNTANASTVAAVGVKLTNTNDIGSGATGQSQNAIDCGLDPCFGVSTPASGPIAALTSITPVGFSAMNVNADNVFSYAYNTSGNGTLVLNDQGFFFNNMALSSLGAGKTNLNTYLVSISFRESSTTDSGFVDLSAITLDTSPAPEPSTVLMLLSGLGAIGFARFRRRTA